MGQEESQTVVISTFLINTDTSDVPRWQPSVYLPILTTENIWQGSTSENQQNSLWDPGKKKIKKKLFNSLIHKF